MIFEKNNLTDEKKKARRKHEKKKKKRVEKVDILSGGKVLNNEAVKMSDQTKTEPNNSHNKPSQNKKILERGFNRNK